MRACDGGRPELVVMVGMQASGKTTWYRDNLAGTHLHASRDLIPGGSLVTQARIVREALAAGRSV